MKLLQMSALGPAAALSGANWILRMIRRQVSLAGGGGRAVKKKAERRTSPHQFMLVHTAADRTDIAGMGYSCLCCDSREQHLLLINLLLVVVSLLGEVGLDLKVHSTGLRGRWNKGVRR